MSGDADTSGVRCSVPTCATCASSIEQLRAQTEYVEQLRESLGISQRALIRSRIEVAALAARVDHADARRARLPWFAVGIACSALLACEGLALSGLARWASALLAVVLVAIAVAIGSRGES